MNITTPKPGLAVFLALGLAAIVTPICAQTINQLAPASASTAADKLELGRYLVFRTGLCIDCHSPRDEQGDFIASRHLAGAVIPFAPTVPIPWVPFAPRLAGLPAGFTEEQLVHFLMTGERPYGRGRPLPPMPPYRFNREEAVAIAAYLRSLPAE